jgi:hypothetical protein
VPGPWSGVLCERLQKKKKKSGVRAVRWLA